MPWNLTRYYGNGDLHFITCSCYWRQPLLGSARPRDLFLTVLEQVRLRYQFVVLGYVVMPEHFHLLRRRRICIRTRRAEPSFKACITVDGERSCGSLSNAAQPELFEHAPPHIWQKRFYDFNVWTERKRLEKLRYLHRRVSQMSGGCPTHSRTLCAVSYFANVWALRTARVTQRAGWQPTTKKSQST
jgi:REP-associated tyrosine transposase